VWVVAEDVGVHRRGDVIEEPRAESRVPGNKALMPTTEGDVALLRQLDRKDLEEYVHDDLRVLPVRFDGTGRRHRTFADAVTNMNDEMPEGGLDLTGPRTSWYRIQSTSSLSQTPVTQSEHWKVAAKIQDGDRSQYEHEALSHILEAMACVDQLNIPSLRSGELSARRLQLIEDSHAHSGAGGADDDSAADHYMGWATRRMGVLIAPELRQHVANNLRGEAEVAKEARKAKEEQRLRRQPGKKGGKEEHPP